MNTTLLVLILLISIISLFFSYRTNKYIVKQSKEIGDDLFDKAVELVKETNEVSIPYLQEKLGIGYARAARMADLLEEKGIKKIN